MNMLQSIGHGFSIKEVGNDHQVAAQLKLTPGEVVRGVVIRKKSGGVYLISARGKHFSAYSELDLKPNQQHRFEVKSTNPRVELKLLDGGLLKWRSPIQLWTEGRTTRDQLAAILKSLPSALHGKGLNSASRQVLEQIQNLLPAIIYSSPKTKDSLWLPRYLLSSGLFWENKVARYLFGEKKGPLTNLTTTDLKGLLLSLLKNVQSEAGKQPDLQSLALKLHQSLQFIEQDQLLNYASLRDGLGWFWFIPSRPEEGLNNAEVFIRQNDSEEINFSIFLDLSLLRHMEVNLSLVKSFVSVAIHVEDKEKSDFINENIPSLGQNLKKAGLNVSTITCGVKETHDIQNTIFSEANAQAPSVHVVI
ncbi:flagellar hook-length control protein FliK [Thermodesulfobacteriota bacterium]